MRNRFLLLALLLAGPVVAEEPRGAIDLAQDEGGEGQGAEVVLSRPPAEVVHLDRFRKK